MLRPDPGQNSTSSFSTDIKREFDRRTIVLCRHGHPFDGQEITVSNRRRWEGTGQLIVEAEFPDGSRRWIPAQWTSLESGISCGIALHGWLSDFTALAELVDALRQRQAHGSGAGTDAVEPAGVAGPAATMGGSSVGCTPGVCGGVGTIDGPSGGSGAGR